MGQNHTVISLDNYRKSKEGSAGSPEREPRSASIAPHEHLNKPLTYTELQVPLDVEPYVTAHQDHPKVTDDLRKLGVEAAGTTPAYGEPSILTELGLTVAKLVKFLEEPLEKSSRWYAQHAQRQLEKEGQGLNKKTGMVEKTAA